MYIYILVNCLGDFHKFICIYVLILFVYPFVMGIMGLNISMKIYTTHEFVEVTMGHMKKKNVVH